MTSKCSLKHKCCYLLSWVNYNKVILPHLQLWTCYFLHHILFPQCDQRSLDLMSQEILNHCEEYRLLYAKHSVLLNHSHLNTSNKVRHTVEPNTNQSMPRKTRKSTKNMKRLQTMFTQKKRSLIMNGYGTWHGFMRSYKVLNNQFTFRIQQNSNPQPNMQEQESNVNKNYGSNLIIYLKIRLNSKS